MVQEIQENKKLRTVLFLSLFSGIAVAAPVLQLGNEQVFLWVNQKLTPGLGQTARVFSLLGESWAMGALLLLSLTIRFSNTLFIALCWLSGAIHSWIFKLWLCKGWPRPLQFFEEKHLSLNLVEGVKVHHWNSFPSGHTITVFSLLILLPVLFPRIPVRTLLMAWILATLCGLSRIVLAQHWPLDVAGGILLGCSATLVTLFLRKSPLLLHPVLDKSLADYFPATKK